MGKRMEIYDFKTNEIFVSRDVIFHEQIFPLSTPKTSTHLDKMDKCSVLRRDNRLLDDERSPREINPLSLSGQPICLGTGAVIEPNSNQAQPTVDSIAISPDLSDSTTEEVPGPNECDPAIEARGSFLGPSSTDPTTRCDSSPTRRST